MWLKSPGVNRKHDSAGKHEGMRNRNARDSSNLLNRRLNRIANLQFNNNLNRSSHETKDD